MATELIRGLSNLPPDFQGCVATIGNFDGVHLGHQALLAAVKEKARELQLPSVAVIFEPQPAEFFAGENNVLPRLTRLREKVNGLAASGIDLVLVLDFDHELANLSAEDFVQQILSASLKVKHVLIGDDFRFGKGRTGDWEFLNKAGVEAGFTVASLPTFLIDGERVSSTRVRKALADANLSLATKLLGHPYTMQGRVVHGEKLGKQLGFPTANIKLQRKVSPLQGIFVVRVHGLSEQPLPGVASLGTRPTVDDSRQNLLEVYLFDFNQDIYGEMLSVEFCEKLRDEIRYDSVALLQQQITKDAAAARAYFSARGELPASPSE